MFLVGLFALFVVVSIVSFVPMAVYATRHAVQEYLPRFEEVRAVAHKQNWALSEEQPFGVPRLRIQATVLEHAASVTFGLRTGDDSYGVDLTLRVESRRLHVTDFKDCWERMWVRYEKRHYEDRLRDVSGPGSVALAGPTHSLRDVFAEVGLAEMACLFGVPKTGRGQGEASVHVGRRAIHVTFRGPGTRHTENLPRMLEALVRLSQFSVRPFGAPAPSVSLIAPRTVGTQRVEVQPEQRCAYCRETLSGASPTELKSCAACASPLHASCLDEHGGCCTVGCRNNPREHRQAERARTA